jgi:hypothetical protein
LKILLHSEEEYLNINNKRLVGTCSLENHVKLMKDGEHLRTEVMNATIRPVFNPDPTPVNSSFRNKTRHEYQTACDDTVGMMTRHWI